MEEDTEYQKLAVEDRVVHKLWKARVHGYEELTKLFRQIDDEKSPEFSKYLGLVKKFVIDSNVLGQEKGLEATLAYVENYANADRTVGEVMSGIVSKCIAAPKVKTRELAVQVVLMYVEIEKHEVVQDELMKGMDIKNPKTVAACVNTTTLALREFGPKVVNVKKLIKKMHTLLSDRDKNVRDETKAMVIEIYRWIGAALKSQITNLQPVQISELEAEFVKVESDKPIPTRFLRSQQVKQAKIAASAAEADEGDGGDEEDSAQPEVDAYDFVDPVNILAKLPGDFYDKCEAKKWQERKEALEALDELVKAPKLENGDYGDVVRMLKKIISKDSNVVVVSLAGKCLGGLANGLKKRFQPYAAACVPALLEKFREKKQNVVTALKDALDAIFPSTTVEVILEDVVEALNNKNPSVKSETASFLTRSFAKCQPTALNKKILKAYTSALLKTLSESDPTVRDNSAEALGTLMKLVGEKAITPFLTDVDNLKMAKIKECCEKAVITAKIGAPKKERPLTAPPKVVVSGGAPKAGSAAPKPVKRPNSSVTTVKKKPSPAVASGKTSAKPKKEQEMSIEEIEERAGEFLPATILPGLADSNWKTRLAATESYQTEISTVEPGSISPQVLIGVLNRKPGFKDTNIQVLKLKLETLKNIIETHGVSNIIVDAIVNDITDKLGDSKTTGIASDVLSAMAESVKLDYVATGLLEYAFTQKSPKVQVESLIYVSNAIKEFGFTLNAKSLVEYAKKGVSATQPIVRSAAITLLGTMYLYMGPALHSVFENEKPALKQQITAEFDKCFGMKPPEPTRGVAKSRSASNNNLDEIEEDGEPEPAFDPQDLIPTVDISCQITETLISEMSDKNWKVRNEALTKVMTIITEAKSIHPSIGDLPQALSQRLTDSNGKIAQTALQICQTMAIAMGPQCKQHVRVLFPGFLSGLSDNKNWMRTASITCINQWGDVCGYKEFFDGEMIGDALKTGSPNLRTELWAWLAEKLGKIPLKAVPKEELMVCLPILYQNLEDRNAEIRKNVQEAVLPFMIHLGYETMAKQTEKLKPGSKTGVMEALEKTRPLVPAKPLPKPKKPVSADKRKTVVPGKTSSATVAKPASGKTRQSVATGAKAPPARKKEDDVDTSPLLLVNNLKHQRVIDEQKLRVLKWNFTQPREEFVELLKDQMTTAKMNRTLIANMFHIDFRYHLKAIEALIEDLPENSQALVSNLDLILKWLSLRFFDTNPSVLLKGLEYLQLVFNMLIENNVKLLENEASSFIPYLILKIGDPKDAVRNGVRSLFKQIARVYPVSKLFSLIMEGLRSKNARQRTECLEELCTLIGSYGTCICQPTPSTALKEIAKQISDRDNSVRNAALNCIVQAYHIEGDKIYKMIGQISDKDQSLLEERIKRAAKKGPSQKPGTQRQSMILQTSPAPPVDTSPVFSREPSDLDNGEDVEIQQELEPPSPVNNDATVILRRIVESHTERPDLNATVIKSSEMNFSEKVPEPMLPQSQGPFFLDPDIIKEIEGDPIVIRRGPPPVDWEKIMQMLDEPIKFPDNYKGPKEIQATGTFHIPGPSISARPSSAGDRPRMVSDHQLENIINQIGSADMYIAQNGCMEVTKILESSKANHMQEYEDLFIRNITTQLQLLTTHSPDNEIVLKGYKALLSSLATFFNGTANKNISKDSIKNILGQLITLLSNRKFESLENKDVFIKVINTQCLNIIEYSEHTNVICALITLLNECVAANESSRHIELVMKCLWRVIKWIPEWADDLDCDTILYDIHLFFKNYSSSFWKQQQSDYPIRTVKTVVHTMAKIRGKNLMSNLSKIQNSSESELQSYLLKVLKTLKLEEVKQIPLKKDPKRRTVPRALHGTLADIFGKIGEKETTIEGLVLLYNFKQQHPEADIEPFLEKTSQFFQEYIEKGLKKIEEQRNNNKVTEDNSQNTEKILYEIGNEQENKHSENQAESLEQKAKRFGVLAYEPDDRTYATEDTKMLMLDMRKKIRAILSQNDGTADGES